MATPKVSPARGMPVNEWIAKKAKGWQADAIHKLIAITQAAAPKATLSIKWNQPVFDQGGPMIFIKPATAHVTFGFWRGAELDDDGLEGGERMKHLKLRSLGDIDDKRIARLVKAAAKLNATKGDPTRR